MQTPDADGYINITWPSKSIPYGGIFHTRIADPNNYSTKEFLKVLLEEAKLPVTQKQKGTWENQLREPAAPPLRPGRGPRRSVLVRPSTSRRRSLSTIRESGVYDNDGYQPQRRGEDREKLKERLQRCMQYGDAEQAPTPAAPAPRAPKCVLPTRKEKKQDLLTQIRERAEWLAEMEDLGAGAPHRDIIQDQIEERMRMLEALGCESLCSSRSSKSGFSTTRSYEKLPSSRASVRSVASKASVISKGSHGSQGKQKTKPAALKAKGEETVEAYNDIPKLQYSPRRRQ